MARKYSNARRSLRSTPSPSAYMRPSFQVAAGWPLAAAYSSALTAALVSPLRKSCVPDWNAWNEVSGTWPGPRSARLSIAGAAFPRGMMSMPTAGATLPGVRVPSKAKAAASPRPAPNNATASKRSYIRIARLLGRPARMGDGAVARRPDLLGIFPDVSRCVGRPARLPRRPPLRELGLAQPHLEGAAVRIDGDDVAVAHQRDRSAAG